MDLFEYAARPTYLNYKKDGTSAQAAMESHNKAATLRIMVLTCLMKHGPMTTDECASKLGKDKLSIRPRFSELFKAGKIKPTGERGLNDSGKQADKWGVV